MTQFSVQTINVNDPDLDYFKRDQLVTFKAALSDLEIATIARQAAIEDDKLNALREQLAEVKSEWAKKIALQETRIADMRSDIAAAQQTRTERCHQVFRNSQIVSFVPDTGVVVHERPADRHEMQLTMPPAAGGGMLAEAAKAQKAAGVEEDEDGDVVPPEDSADAKPKKRGKGK